MVPGLRLRSRRLTFVVSAASLVLFAQPNAAPAQVLVSHYLGDSANPVGAIGEYNLDGTAINPALIQANGDRIAVSDSKVFVLRNIVGFAGVVGEYTTSGATIDSEFITGIYGLRELAASDGSLFVSYSSNVGNVLKFDLAPPFSSGLLISDFQLANGLAVSADGGRLYVADSFAGTIGEYDASTGAPINPALVTGLDYPTVVAVSGSKLFVVTLGDFLVGTVGAYALDGTPINRSLISGLDSPTDIAEFDGKLYIANSGAGKVGEFDAVTGATINDDLITGLRGVSAIAIVPEPATGALLACGAALLLAVRRMHRKNRSQR
jgi:hypothetical protein